VGFDPALDRPPKPTLKTDLVINVDLPYTAYKINSPTVSAHKYLPYPNILPLPEVSSPAGFCAGLVVLDASNAWGISCALVIHKYILLSPLFASLVSGDSFFHVCFLV
jgi:hypothetical protein